MRSVSRLPLRLRLTLWYVLLLALTVVIFGTYVHVRLERSVIAQTDTTLRTAISEVAVSVDTSSNGLTFRTTPSDQATIRRLEQTGIAARLITPDGTIRGSFGREMALPATAPIASGIRTLSTGEADWRVDSQRIATPDRGPIGWLQVGASLSSEQTVLETLFKQALLGLPLVLLLAGLGGMLLAYWALHPIDRMTRTAQTVSARDLTQRINYEGPADEVGRLAITFDRMLNRLQAGFARERRFTADVSHELRTPLAAIKGRIGVTLDRPRTEGAYEETLKDIERETDRLIRLSSNLLYLSRLEQAELPHDLRQLDLGELLDTIAEQIRPMTDARDIALRLDLAPDLVTRGDFDHLTRLFLNLLDNAVKYTPHGGQVTVGAARQAAQIRVTISDTGSGIPTEALPHLFERFYRVADDRSRETGGAGLGLAIADEIARAHSGMLTVQSEVGQGTTFTVVLPVRQ